MTNRSLSRFALLALAWSAASFALGAPEFKGMSYTAFGQNVLFSSGSDQSIANMAAIGVDTVALNIWEFQDNANSSEISLDFSEFSASIPSIEHAIDEIHSQGMQVLLKPNVDLRNGAWRGTIQPSAAWFAEYSDFINDWATFAESNGVAMLSVGTEYRATESSEAEWRSVIDGVRQRYNGPITYSANWDSYNTIEWWDEVDYIGIDAYFPLTDKNDPTLAELTAAWEGHANTIESWRSSEGHSQNVIFAEVGYRSADGANQRPFEFGTSATPDPQEQADAYEALLSTMTQRDWWDGAFWWNWETNPSAGGLSNTNYTPQNKPAQSVIQSYYQGNSGGPGSGSPSSQTLHSWEAGLEGWSVPSFADHPASLAVSPTGATDGGSALGISHTVANGGANHFSWDAQVRLSNEERDAIADALVDPNGDYELQFDVTYEVASIHQGSGLSFLNLSVAIDDPTGGWSQIDGLGLTSGSVDETQVVAISLGSFGSLSTSSSFYDLFIALNGNWGPGTATVYLDNLRLVNLNALLGDYDGDGSVSAADYAVWRSGAGDGGAYSEWTSGFGAGAVTPAAIAIPEPHGYAILAMSCLGIAYATPRKLTDWNRSVMIQT